MAIKKYFVTNPKEGYIFDRREKKYYSWGYDIWLNGSRVHERGFKSREIATEVAHKLKQDAKLARHGIVPPTESPQLIELFQKKLDSFNDAPKERVRSKTIFTRFLKLLPAGIKVTDLKQAHIQQYVTARLSDMTEKTKKPITPQTVLRELVPITAALNAAGKFFVELDDYRPPRIPRPKVPKGCKDRVISRSEQTAILSNLLAVRGEENGKKEDRRAFESRIRTGHFLLFMLSTLSRPGEVAALKKTDVNFDLDIVTIVGTKTRYTSHQIVRQLKITPTMRKILEERIKLATRDFVFTTGGKVTPQMYNAFKNACETNGIAYGREGRDTVSFHTARHTGITRLLQSGKVDLKTIGRMSGHSDARMTMYYSHSDIRLTDAASDILETDLL